MFAPFANDNQFDPDAGAFINATGIGGIEAIAINNLVNQLKANGLWTPMLAIYPMVGGTAQSCKFNLVNPQDTNAAYRLNFNGTWTFSAQGAKPNGAAGTYADTNFSPVTKLTATNGHLSYYSFTNSAANGQVEIGSTDGAATNESLIAGNFNGNFYVFWAGNGGAGGGIGASDSSGFFINNKAYGSTSNDEGWRNGSLLINTGTSNQTTPTSNLYLGAENNSGATNYRNSDRGCCFSSFGYSIPSGQQANFTIIVNNFNKTLGRNTF